MSRKTTLSACFAFFGASGANSRWSWSARSDDGATVVITLWSDHLSYRGNEVTYESVSDGTGPWRDRLGNRERIENLKWARDHCDGWFKAVITVARDVNEEPRQIKECFPQPNLRMKLTELNDVTGGFAPVTSRKERPTDPSPGSQAQFMAVGSATANY